jgi:hypothetical protein
VVAVVVVAVVVAVAVVEDGCLCCVFVDSSKGTVVKGLAVWETEGDQAVQPSFLFVVVVVVAAVGDGASVAVDGGGLGVSCFLI